MSHCADSPDVPRWADLDGIHRADVLEIGAPPNMNIQPGSGRTLWLWSLSDTPRLTLCYNEPTIFCHMKPVFNHIGTGGSVDGMVKREQRGTREVCWR